MTTYFLDASALAKRYLHETGSRWIFSLTARDASNTIIVSELSLVEVASAIAARHRAPRGITIEQRDGAIDLLAKHMKTDYQLISTNPEILDHAVRLTQTYRLRGYDSVQLATAAVTHKSLVDAGLAGLIFLTADADLEVAADLEGLPADNPLQHVD